MLIRRCQTRCFAILLFCDKKYTVWEDRLERIGSSGRGGEVFYRKNNTSEEDRKKKLTKRKKTQGRREGI